MHMIRNPSNTLGRTSKAMDDSAKVFMKPRTPFWVDQRLTVLRGKYQMIKKAGVRGRRSGMGWIIRTALASL